MRPELDPWVGNIPWWGGHGNPLQYSCLENLHGQRSPVGCSPWVAESDMTEWLSTAQHNLSGSRSHLVSFFHFLTIRKQMFYIITFWNPNICFQFNIYQLKTFYLCLNLLNFNTQINHWFSWVSVCHLFSIRLTCSLFHFFLPFGIRLSHKKELTNFAFLSPIIATFILHLLNCASIFLFFFIKKGQCNILILIASHPFML